MAEQSNVLHAHIVPISRKNYFQSGTRKSIDRFSSGYYTLVTSTINSELILQVQASFMKIFEGDMLWTCMLVVANLANTK